MLKIVISLVCGIILVGVHDIIGRGNIAAQIVYTIFASIFLYFSFHCTIKSLIIILDGKQDNDISIRYPKIIGLVAGFWIDASLIFLYFWVWTESDVWTNLGTWSSTSTFLVWQRLFSTAILALGVGTLSYVPIGIVSEVVYSFVAAFQWAVIGSVVLSVALSIVYERKQKRFSNETPQEEYYDNNNHNIKCDAHIII